MTTIRALTLALPAALGLACSHSQGASSPAASASGQDEGGVATASARSSAVRGHEDDRVVSGVIADASGSSFVVQSSSGERRTLVVVEETTITIDGAQGRITDLVPGQVVRASYGEQDGQDIAVKVMATGSGGASGASRGTSP